MKRFWNTALAASFLFLSNMAAPAADFNLMDALRQVEKRYNNIKTMKVEFTQSTHFTAQPTAKRSEAGVLYLKRPGRMRWDYTEPRKKLFLSDGRNVYFYLPAANRAERSPLKESDDMRAPLGFLIGRLDFDRDFKEYRHRAVDGGRLVIAKPKSDKAPYKEVEFLLTADNRIARLRVLGHDSSVMDFRFQNEVLNPNLGDDLFVFEAPPGVEFVDVSAGG